MKREFASNIALLILINLLIKPAYIFGVDRSVQNLVGAEDFGIYFALYNFAFLFQIVNDFGIQNFNNRHIARHPHLLEKYFPHFLTLKGMLGLTYLVLVLLGALLAGYPPGILPFLFWIGFNWMLNALLLYLRSNVSGLGYYRTDSLLSVLDRFLMILVLGPVLLVPAWRSGFDIHDFVYAQTLSLGVACLIAFRIGRRKIQAWRVRFDKRLMAVILRQSYPFALAVLLMTVYTRIDGVMIERMLDNGRTEAGIYASAYRLLDAANMMGFLFAGLLLPMFSRMLKAGEPVGPLTGMAFQWLFAGAVTLAMAVGFFSEPIMRSLYVTGDAYSGQILVWLMAAFVAMAGTYIYGTLLTAHGNMRPMNLIFIAGIALNVLLNALLIPGRGALGAAVATAFTQWATLLAQVALAGRQFGLTARAGALVRLAGFASGMAASCYLLQNLAAGPWIVKFLACAPAGLLLAFTFRLLQLRDFRVLLPSGRD